MKYILRILVISLFLALIGLGLISCGARRVNKSHTEESTKTEVTDNSNTVTDKTTNVKTTTNTTTDYKNESITEETIYEPKNTSIEAYIIEKDGTKTVLNNATKTVRKVTKKNNTSTRANIAQVQNTKQAVTEQKDVKHVSVSKKKVITKEVKKEAVSWYNWLWLLIIPVMFVVTYRIYKKLPLVPKL
jgi:hypothetical protein